MTENTKENKIVVDEKTIEEMYRNGAHFGYKKSKRHPSMTSFIYGMKNNNEIFDLEKIYEEYVRAYEFVKKAVSEGKIVLFAGEKFEAIKAVREVAESCGMPYAVGRWIGGTITNFNEIKKRVKRFTELKDQKESGEFLKKYTKKERLLIDREIKDLEEKFGGIENMQRVPDVLYVVDPKNEETAVREANRKNIPIVALSNSDCDIKDIDYPIPANDSARASIEYFTKKIAEACLEGKKNKTE